MLQGAFNEPQTGAHDMIYILRSPAGTFTIEPDEQTADMVKLCIGGMWLASFQTAEEAANVVMIRETGWMDWDRAKTGDCPACLEEWEQL
jgi:hypothetical protein